MADALCVDPGIDLASLKRTPPKMMTPIERNETGIYEPRQRIPYVKPLGFFAGLIPGRRATHAVKVAAATLEEKFRYRRELQEYERLKQLRFGEISGR